MTILDDTIATLQKNISDVKAVPAVASLIKQRADLLKELQSLNQQINTALGPDVLEAEETLQQLSRQQNLYNSFLDSKIVKIGKGPNQHKK